MVGRIFVLYEVDGIRNSTLKLSRRSDFLQPIPSLTVTYGMKIVYFDALVCIKVDNFLFRDSTQIAWDSWDQSKPEPGCLSYKSEWSSLSTSKRYKFVLC